LLPRQLSLKKMGFAKLQTFCGLEIFPNISLGIGNKIFRYR
jgi:hypothetical protein